MFSKRISTSQKPSKRVSVRANSNRANNVRPKNYYPDPYNYKVLLSFSFNNYLAVFINYPNCTNYEGNKILVFKDISLNGLLNQKYIDPHFFDDVKDKVSPIARFVPTDEGWNMACKLVVDLGGSYENQNRRTN